MNKTKKDRLLAGSMSIMVAASSLMPAAAVHAEDTQLSRMITPVMISEIVADTHQSDQLTASGTDAFEYIELYNTSDRDIEMDDLLIRNVNGSTLTDWEIPSGTVIKAGQTLVVW
ncbi:MAG: lamin tail domain-containing protein [Merdibacter sp.]